MIKLTQPALAINTFDVPRPHYRMDQTVKLTKYASAMNVIAEIDAAVGRTPQSHLENVVINCHGSPGYLYIGEIKVKTFDENMKLSKERFIEGIGAENVALFSLLRGRIGTIWITGCQVAGGSGIVQRSGHTFLPQLATTVGCNVIAANVSQYVGAGLRIRLVPKDHIDDFEGTAYKWDANGNRTVFKQGLI